MFGLSEKNIQQLIAVVSSIPEIEEVIVYGSRARGDNKPNSDVDLALKGKVLTLNELAQLEEKIDYLYLPYFFDLCLFSGIKNKALLGNIQKEGKVLYSA